MQLQCLWSCFSTHELKGGAYFRLCSQLCWINVYTDHRVHISVVFCTWEWLTVVSKTEQLLKYFSLDPLEKIFLMLKFRMPPWEGFTSTFLWCALLLEKTCSIASKAVVLGPSSKCHILFHLSAYLRVEAILYASVCLISSFCWMVNSHWWYGEL